MVADMQALNTAGGKSFVGVNFGAMDKYRAPLTLEQWKNCVASLKVLVPWRYVHLLPLAGSVTGYSLCFPAFHVGRVQVYWMPCMTGGGGRGGRLWDHVWPRGGQPLRDEHPQHSAAGVVPSFWSCSIELHSDAMWH